MLMTSFLLSIVSWLVEDQCKLVISFSISWFYHLARSQAWLGRSVDNPSFVTLCTTFSLQLGFLSIVLSTIFGIFMQRKQEAHKDWRLSDLLLISGSAKCNQITNNTDEDMLMNHKNELN